VIGATPFALRTSRLSGVEFETVIFDEASQITLPLAIMGMLAAKRFILIGDHKQLPPVFQTIHHGNPLLRESIFGLLAGRGFDTMLSETYRLNTDLVEWPSRVFYNGELTPVPAVADRRIEYPNPPQRLAEILDPHHPKVFLDLQHRNSTTHCQAEASIVVDLVHTLLMSGIAANEIGIVAPYRAQGREIRDLLRKALPDATTRRQIVTDTVERLQGQERDVVILSLTTSNPVFAADLAEFFFQPERLNVAVTRPRKKLIIVGSSHVLNAQPEDPELARGVDLLRGLLKSCTYRTLEYPS
jgi:DNA replication ATP-dependent helicase/nuclease Dna2